MPLSLKQAVCGIRSVYQTIFSDEQLGIFLIFSKIVQIKLKLGTITITCWQTWACCSNVEKEDKGECNVNQGVHPLDNEHYHKGAQCLKKDKNSIKKLSLQAYCLQAGSFLPNLHQLTKPSGCKIWHRPNTGLILFLILQDLFLNLWTKGI